MTTILLVTPPFVQVNTPYPATAYLKGYLDAKGYRAEQFDLSIELIGGIFSRGFLEEVFAMYEGSEDENIKRIFSLRERYMQTVGPVADFLRGGSPELATLICGHDFLPQASRFEGMDDLQGYFGNMGDADCAKHLCTLFLQDISDFIRSVVTPHFEIVRYGEKISVSVPDFSAIEKELIRPANIIEQRMTALLESKIAECSPKFIGFTIPFPGNLLSTLRCCRYVKENHPDIKLIIGGGYPSTELRSMSGREIFRYIDYCVLDGGELALERILADVENPEPGVIASEKEITHLERGCPDFSGLPHHKYMSLLEVTNPMHRLWSDGRWNKMTVAHGCYWAKCAFCDTSLDYIRNYNSVPASVFVDWIERVMDRTGSRGFHFTDEAAPPKMLRDISLEIIRRGLKVAWWTNIRFEAAFTTDLAALMAAAGCIALSGGLEAASDRLLEVMNKGITVEQATIALRNFYYAGIMTHTYLMYGFPTQTLQECVDSLEVVRQMFRAELIGSAFWHRFAMTVHSPCGKDPEKYGVRVRAAAPNSFANNEIRFSGKCDYNMDMAGDAFRESLAAYMSESNLERAAHKWFRGKDVPHTTIESSLIADHLIKPDNSRLYDPGARLVWIGVDTVISDEGLLFNNASESKTIKFTPPQRDFVLRIIRAASDLSRKFTLEDAAGIYGEYSEEPFAAFFLSKKWDVMRRFGMLKV